MKKAEQVKAHDERSLATTKGEAEFLRPKNVFQETALHTFWAKIIICFAQIENSILKKSQSNNIQLLIIKNGLN